MFPACAGMTVRLAIAAARLPAGVSLCPDQPGRAAVGVPVYVFHQVRHGTESGLRARGRGTGPSRRRREATLQKTS